MKTTENAVRDRKGFARLTLVIVQMCIRDRGMDDFLSKPLNVTVMLQKLEAVRKSGAS